MGSKLTEKERLKLQLQLEKEKQALAEIEAKHRMRFPLFYFSPYWYQAKVIEYFREGANIVNMPLSNKVGKSRIGSALVHSWALGYEPWNPVPETYPGAVRVGDRFFMPSSLGKKPPVDIRITGEDWEEHLKKTIVPELKGFSVKPIEKEWEISKNNVGVEATWRHKKTGSTFNLMTYKQDIGSFESFVGDAWWADEPPPKPIWSAISRALFIRGGKVFMSMTPLKEAWIWDEIINSNRPDVKTIKGVTLWDAPHLYKHDLSILMKCGLTKEDAELWLQMQKEEARKNKSLLESEKWLKEKIGSKTAVFINEFNQTIEIDAFVFAMQKLVIHRFIKDLKDDTERIPRVFGEPKYLMGRVLKSFDPDIHIVDDFKIPPDWPVAFQIDFHLNLPHAISYCAVDKYGRYFICGETWQNMDAEGIADDIIRKKQAGWRIMEGEIDALSKGDTSYVKNRLGDVQDSFTRIQEKLSKFQISLGVGSKDEKSYINALEGLLKGVNGPPLLYIFRSCTETIKQIERWTYNENGKPSSEGHFPECIGRFTQMGLKYIPMGGDIYKKARENMPRALQQSVGY